MRDDCCDSEIVLGRFSRLMRDLLEGQTSRTCFQPWEIELLLDIESCDVNAKRRPEILRRYQRAVEKQLDYGILPPMKLSEYLSKTQRG